MSTANEVITLLPRRSRWASFGLEALSLGMGVVATYALFLAITHFKGERAEPAPEIEDLRAVSLPPEPPPKVVVQSTPVEIALPFAGLEVAASDSSVKISVLPPDLDSLVPKTRIPPAAVIQASQWFPELKPKTKITTDFQQVFQPAEVDQRVAVLSRPEPRWPRVADKDVASVRATFLLVVNVNGGAENVRLVKSSGFPEFDQQVQQQMLEEWVFSPALKDGRKVRCLVQQSVVVSKSAGSRFSL